MCMCMCIVHAGYIVINVCDNRYDEAAAFTNVVPAEGTPGTEETGGINRNISCKLGKGIAHM